MSPETPDPNAPEGSTTENRHSETVRSDRADSDGIAMTIVESVATVTDRTSGDLPPLQRSVDTDALGALLDSDSPVEVTFSYAATRVRAHSDGTVEVRAE